MKRNIILLICLLVSFAAKAQFTVLSPDKTARVYLRTEKRRGFNTKILRSKTMRIDVVAKNKFIVNNRDLGLVIYAKGKRASFGKSDMVNCSYTTKTITAADESVFAEAGLEGKYNAMVMESVAGILFEIVVFNNGVACRFSTTGFADDYEYKILEVTNPFPADKPNAILGTFTGDKVLPWRIMLFDEVVGDLAAENEWKDIYPHTKVVPWKDALSSASAGFTTNWIAGKTWGDTSASQGAYVDFIYKYLYAGLSYTPCHELQYVFWGYDFYPFTQVMGSIHSWDVTGRLGFNLPIQNGYDLWYLSPYVTATHMALLQHGKIHPISKEVAIKGHTLVGLGLKTQFLIRERISLGVGYEFQFFTGRNEPTGRNTFTFSMGVGF